MITVSISRADAKSLLDFCRKNNLEEFFFAKDQGAYFGANIGKFGTDTFANCVHYIDGCNPKDDDWYENARDRFGGDDFGVHLPIGWLMVILESPKHIKKKRFSIRLGMRSVVLVE